MCISGTSDNGHSKEWTTSLQEQTVFPLLNIVHTFLPPKKVYTASEKWTKHSSPKCPSFRGSTVEYINLEIHNDIEREVHTEREGEERSSMVASIIPETS